MRRGKIAYAPSPDVMGLFFLVSGKMRLINKELKYPIAAPAKISVGQCTPTAILAMLIKIAEIKNIHPHFLLI